MFTCFSCALRSLLGSVIVRAQSNIVQAQVVPCEDILLTCESLSAGVGILGGAGVAEHEHHKHKEQAANAQATAQRVDTPEETTGDKVPTFTALTSLKLQYLKFASADTCAHKYLPQCTRCTADMDKCMLGHG